MTNYRDPDPEPEQNAEPAGDAQGGEGEDADDGA